MLVISTCVPWLRSSMLSHSIRGIFKVYFVSFSTAATLSMSQMCHSQRFKATLNQTPIQARQGPTPNLDPSNLTSVNVHTSYPPHPSPSPLKSTNPHSQPSSPSYSSLSIPPPPFPQPSQAHPSTQQAPPHPPPPSFPTVAQSRPTTQLNH